MYAHTPLHHAIGTRVLALQDALWYAILIVILALVSICLLAYELWYPHPDPKLVHVAQKIDLAIAWIFLTDFFLGLYFSNLGAGRRAFWKHNWLNLVSSLPITSDMARALRILRILRAMRVIRAGMNFWFAHSRERMVAELNQKNRQHEHT